MNGKRWLEIGSGLLLLLTLMGGVGGYVYWRIQRDRATQELVRATQAFDTHAMRDAVLRGADVEARSGWNGRIQPTYVAIAKQDPELLRFILDRGANPNARDSQGMTPLMWQPSYATTEVLLAHGADPNAADNDGESVLTCVVWRGDEEALRLARLLLEHGAKPGPMDLRAAQGDARMIALLKGAAARR